MTQHYKPGDLITHNERQFVITAYLDISNLIVRDPVAHETKRVNIAEIKPYRAENPDTPSAPVDFIHVPDEDWRIAQERFDILRPLLDTTKYRRSDKAVMEIAAKAGKHHTTIYRWLENYERTNSISALLPRERSDLGKSRLSAEVEAVIREVIENRYLTEERRSVQDTCDEVARICKEKNLPKPHPNTVRNRVATISEHLKYERRQGRQAARRALTPLTGSLDAPTPLHYTQIDHTPLDIILVDDQYRLPLGEAPFLTLAFDPFSRMVQGWYLAFEKPSALSVGLCLVHAILPKENWLATHKISSPWPCWGVPKTIHVDNAKEFRGKMLERACEIYGMDITFRPVKNPHYGGHIERMLDTLGKEIRQLEGTKFNNPQKRGNYKSAEKAIMTLDEFEEWLSVLILEKYHNRKHSALGMSPLKKYEEGILGTATQPGIGLPVRIEDERRLRLDFMPFVERTVQQEGIVIDKIWYQHDVLRGWIEAKESGKKRTARKFIIRRDPRDISEVHFLDPELNDYFPIPYKDPTRPSISLWELRAANRDLEKQGFEDNEVGEERIFEAVSRMRAIEAKAKADTKESRRRYTRLKRAGKLQPLPPRPGEGDDPAPVALPLEDEPQTTSSFVPKANAIEEWN